MIQRPLPPLLAGLLIVAACSSGGASSTGTERATTDPPEATGLPAVTDPYIRAGDDDRGDDDPGDDVGERGATRVAAAR